MKRVLVALAVLLVALAQLSSVQVVSAQEELKDLEVKIEAPGVRYPGEWFDVTIKVTNSSWVDTYFSAIVWLEKPAWGGEYKLLQVGSNTGVGERCDSSRCVFAWSGSIGWEQYKLLIIRVNAGSELSKHLLVRVELTQFPPLFPSRIDKEAYLTIASPPETAPVLSQPTSVSTPVPSPTPTPISGPRVTFVTTFYKGDTLRGGAVMISGSGLKPKSSGLVQLYYDSWTSGLGPSVPYPPPTPAWEDWIFYITYWEEDAISLSFPNNFWTGRFYIEIRVDGMLIRLARPLIIT